MEQNARAAAAGPEARPGDIAAERAAYSRIRAFWQNGGPDVAEVHDFTAPGPGGGSLPVRLYRPDAGARAAPAVVYCHGGGWFLGGLDTHDRLCRRLAVESGCAVLAADYRLAPEHPHPAQTEDTRAALAFVRQSGGAHGLAEDRMALGGDSAGGHMTLAAAMAERDAGRADIAGLALFYGAFGLTDGPAWRFYGGPEDGMTRADMLRYIGLMLGGQDTAEYDLLSRDLSGLPPAHLEAAELDPLADDSRALAELITAAGGEAALHVNTGLLHGFSVMDRTVAKADRAVRRAADFLRRVLKP